MSNEYVLEILVKSFSLPSVSVLFCFLVVCILAMFSLLFRV